MKTIIETYHEDCVADILLLQESKQYPVCEDPTSEELNDEMLALRHPLNSGEWRRYEDRIGVQVLPADDDLIWDQIAHSTTRIRDKFSTQSSLQMQSSVGL